MKKNILINSIIIFIISFPIHFLYDLFPCFFTSIFSPVNESIFEHMKMIFTAILIGRIIIYFIRKSKNLSVNNYIFKSYIGALINIIIFLIMYLPVYYLFGEIMAVTLILYFISIVITEIIMNKIFDIEIKYNLNCIGICLIILTYLLATYFSYNPIETSFFYDPENHNYGIIKK